MRLGEAASSNCKQRPMKVSSTCPSPPLAVSPPRHFIQCFSSLLAHRKQVRRRIREGIPQSNSAPTANNGDGSAGRKQHRAMVTPTDLSFHVYSYLAFRSGWVGKMAAVVVCSPYLHPPHATLFPPRNFKCSQHEIRTLLPASLQFWWVL